LDKEKLKEELRRDEGLRLKAYHCSTGHLTIGYGHLIENTRNITHCSLEQAEAWLDKDIKNAILVVVSYLLPARYESLDEIRQRVLVNMAYNLGFRLIDFKRLHKAILVKDWKRAADEMLASIWADQVGDRAKRLARMMESGSDEGI
jgi:lysozyme